MQEKVIEIIVFILSQLGESKGIGEIDIGKLSGDGYTDAEINSAFAWIFSKIESGQPVFRPENPAPGSKRFFHTYEKKILTKDAIGYLIQLRELGILSDTDIETVIDRLISAGYHRAGSDEVKLIVSSIIFESENGSDLRYKLILQNNETVH